MIDAVEARSVAGCSLFLPLKIYRNERTPRKGALIKAIEQGWSDRNSNAGFVPTDSLQIVYVAAFRELQGFTRDDMKQIAAAVINRPFVYIPVTS